MMLFFLLVLFSSPALAHWPGVHEHGYWYGSNMAQYHSFDFWFSNALAQFLKKEKAKRVVDFGCGAGLYLRILSAHQIYAEGYDGNPDTFELTGGLGQVADLSEPLNLGVAFDWVISLNVANCIPDKYIATYIETLDRHAKKGIILSWAALEFRDFWSPNSQKNVFVKELMERYGYESDLAAENELRDQASLPLFKSSLMVFRRAQNHAQ